METSYETNVPKRIEEAAKRCIEQIKSSIKALEELQGIADDAGLKLDKNTGKITNK